MKSRIIGTAVAFALAVVSTLTVTADDVTLPAGYTKLDYIASTGTQYINTGLFPSDRLSITMDFGHFRLTNSDTAKPGSLFGTVSGANFYDAYVECINQGFGQKQLKFIGVAVGTVIDTAVDEWAANDVHLVLDGGDGTKDADNKYVGTMSISVNGGEPKVVSVQTSAETNPGYPFCVFARANCGWPGTFRLYGMKAVKADKTVLFELVPCISPDGEIGVYDLAGKRFLGNSGTGTFLTPSDAAQDLVKNGGFDIGTVQAQGWNYRNELQGSCPNWTFDGLFTGLTRPATTWVYWNRPIGKYAAFMQQASSDMVISQKFSVTRPGDYVLSFDYASRPNYTAKPSHVELYDAAGGLVGNISTEVVGDAMLTTTTVAYPNVVAGEYTVKLIHNGVSGDGGCVFDNVSFTPVVRRLEEGSGLFLFDGDTTLDNVLVTDRDFVTKNGAGAVIAPSACASLPEMRISKGEFSVQDGVATSYAIGGALILKEGTTLAIDMADGACDSFAASSLAIGGLMTLKIAGATTDGMCGRSFVIFKGVTLTESDLEKIALDAALPIELGLNASGELVANVLLPANYTKLAWIASTGTQYINTGLYPSDRLSITMDLGHFRITDPYSAKPGSLFGTVSGANFYDAYVECINQGFGQKQLKFIGVAVGTVIDTAVDEWAANDVHLVIDGGDGTKDADNKYVGTMSISVNGGEPKVVSVQTSAETNPGYPFCVFARANCGWPGTFRLYGMKAVKADKTVLFELVPCISPDGEIGVYDLAGKRFLGNSGTGTFLTPSDAAQDLVKNGGFDIGSVNEQGFLYAWQSGFSCENWTFKGNEGLTRPGSAVALWNRPYGKYAAFLQSQAAADQTISQSFTVTRPGDYILSFEEEKLPNRPDQRSCVEIYDSNNELVNGISTEITDGAPHAYSIPYAALAVGEYTLKLIHFANSADGGRIFDNVSFTPAIRTVEEGGGVYLFEGDRTLSAALIEGKAFVNKSGTGELVAPASLADLPSIRLPASTFSVQDGVATDYTLNGALMLKGGSTLKIDVTATGCDTFAVAGVQTGSASTTDRIFVSVSGAGVSGGSIVGKKLLVSGAGLSKDDAKKFKVTGARGRCVVENGDLYLDAPLGLFVVVK